MGHAKAAEFVWQYLLAQGSLDLTTMQDLADCLFGGERTWQCPNCLAGQHQCFICKQEGSSEVKKVVA